MKIAILISGGVDSSVSLRLLKEQGHDVTAFYLKIWLEDEMAFLGECPWEEDLEFVRAVCEQASVPLKVVPFQKEYWERVVAYTLTEVKAGRTPNPDMLCNPQIKFGAFYDAFGKEFDKIATGHYAQVEEVICHPHKSGDPSTTDPILFHAKNKEVYPRESQMPSTLFSSIQGQRSLDSRLRGNDKLFLLKRSPDPIKDQTYFLSQLSQAQVARAMFPIGHLRKSAVRILAKKFKLPNAERKDSQGICFLGKIAFDKFLEYHLGKRAGDILEHETVKKLGEHDGFWYYTIGQRRGIRLSGGPWYVVAKDPEKNIISISNHWRGDEARDVLEIEDVNWVSGEAPKKRELSVKIRHGAHSYPCRLRFLHNGNIQVKLDSADAGIAPGQFAVFYDGEYCLGGGVIL